MCKICLLRLDLFRELFVHPSNHYTMSVLLSTNMEISPQRHRAIKKHILHLVQTIFLAAVAGQRPPDRDALRFVSPEYSRTTQDAW